MSSAPAKSWRWGLRSRIVLYTSVVLGITLALAFMWSVYNLCGVLQERNDAFLRHELSEFTVALTESVEDPERRSDPLEAFHHVARAAEEEGFYALLKRDGKTVSVPAGEAPHSFEQSLGATEVGSMPLTIRVADIPAGVRTCGAIVTDDRGENWTIVLGLPLTESEQTIASFNARMVAGSALFLVLSVLSGLFLTRQAIQPVADGIAAARRLNPDDLSARLPRTGSEDELDLLAATVNDLLDRLARYHEQTVQFTADASHELRGPLASLQAAIEVALQQPRSVADYHELLSALGEKCHRLTDLVNDLLFLARADVGQIDLQRAPVDLAEVVSDAVETYRPLAEEKGVSLEWQGANHVVCPGDRMRLLQLTMNLVDNAIKFTPSGGSVRLTLARNGSQVLLDVEDTGIGIPAGHLPRIFERFYQVDEARSEGGTGLGLSICRWVATAHGGTIDANNRADKASGTAFQVRLPIAITEPVAS